ncbi:MAG: GNAT family N-acetyltransferase [Pseudomonadota bacterium]
MRFLQLAFGGSPGAGRFTARISHLPLAFAASCIETHDMQIDLSSSELTRAQPSEWKTVADITAEAFATDPVNQYIFGKPNSIRSMFRVMAREMYLPDGECYLHPAGGATMWMPPGIDSAPSQMGKLAFALGQLRHGTPGAIQRGLNLSALMTKWHPKEPHYYLFTIGTTAAARGKGVGKGLLAPVLAACDAASMPVYLENSNPDNSGFYGAHGFERMGVFHIDGEDSPIMEPMWRAPLSST